MIKYLLLSIANIISINFLFGQQPTIKLSFEKAEDTLRRAENDVIYPITLKLDSIGMDEDSLSFYTVEIKVDEEKSTLPKSSYNLNFNSVKLDKIKSTYTLFLVLKKDIIVDRDRELNLFIEIKRDSKQVGINISNSNQTLNIIAQSIKTINNYNYLAYIGTNFDLIDGVKAKNLFFAVNLFSPHLIKGDGLGFNLILYGNRTLTLTDTSGRVNFTSKVVGIAGDSARYFQEEGLKTVTRVSDNLGATFSPLIRFCKFSKRNKKTQIFYAPQFEFIWRRTEISTEYTDIVFIDSSLVRANRPIIGTLTITPTKEKKPINIYDVYYGLLGLYLSHENNHISIRIQSAAGFNFSYTAEGVNMNNKPNLYTYSRNWSCLGYVRTWITEPTSGITFGAEVSNAFLRGDYQPYYNVTLSKAINLNTLGAIFKPIATR